MSTLELKKLKSLLQETVVNLGAAGSVSSGAVIAALRKADPDSIEAANRELQDGMMHRLLSQIATRRPKNKDGQADFFAGYSGLQQIIGVDVVRGDHRSTEWKLLEKASLAELSAWLATDHRSIATRRQRKPGMTKLLRDLSKAAKGQHSMSVERAMKLLRSSGGGGGS